MEKNLTTLEKLLEIKKSVEFLKKETKAEGGQKFKFTPSSQVIMSVRAEMNKQGMLLVPTVTSTVFHHKDQNQSKMHLTEIAMTWTWIDVNNPKDTLACPWYAQGCDQHEKGVGKAYTYSEKYFILKFFNIPTDADDPDFGRGSKPGKKPQPKDDGGKPGGATKKQYGLLYVKGKENGLDEETVKDMIRWFRSGDYLLVKEASNLIDDFNTRLGQYLDNKAKDDE